MNDADKKLQHLREQLADLRAERYEIQEKLIAAMKPVRAAKSELDEAEARIERQLRLIWMAEDEQINREHDNGV